MTPDAVFAVAGAIAIVAFAAGFFLGFAISYEPCDKSGP